KVAEPPAGGYKPNRCCPSGSRVWETGLVPMSTSPSPGYSITPSGKTAPLRGKRWLVAVLCLAAPVAPGPYFAYPFALAARQQRLACQALEQQDLTRARFHLERSLTLRPNDASSHFLLAQTLRRADEFAGAREYLKAAEALGWKEDEVQLEKTLM